MYTFNFNKQLEPSDSCTNLTVLFLLKYSFFWMFSISFLDTLIYSSDTSNTLGVDNRYSSAFRIICGIDFEV